MFIKENIMLALAGLKANKMRALLTMLGIIIGIASVIGVVSVGNAMTDSVTTSLASMGATNITVNVQEKSAMSGSSSSQDSSSGSNSAGSSQSSSNGKQTNGKNSGSSSQSTSKTTTSTSKGKASTGGRIGKSSKTAKDSDLMSISQINALQEEFDDKISAVSISENGTSGKVKSETSYANISTIGTNIGYKDVKNIQITQGRYLSQNDIDEVKNVAVVSDKLVAKIFGTDADPIGQEIKVYQPKAIHVYYVVGVYEYKASGSSRTLSDENLTTDLYIPISTEKKTATKMNFQMFQIKPKNDVNVQDFTSELSTYLSNLYIKNKEYEAAASNMESMLESRTSMMNTIALAISGIAGISLVVGGIGVMNIMLVSVTERTREIGTRKALGAKSGHIKMQFIVESIIICSIGGILGIMLGLGAGVFVSRAMGYAATVTPVVIIISFMFSMAIGIFFGYYPAKKAAELDPIEALRYE
jgi:putative ABC transport system permease protein